MPHHPGDLRNEHVFGATLPRTADGAAEAAFLPTVEIDLDEDQAKRVFRLIEALEDSDDVQDVYANYSVSDDIMEKLG